LNNQPENIELGAVKVASEMHSDCCGHEQIILQTAHEHHHLKITTIILEFGIALHSIIIGVALGVARGPEFKSLFIALAFHQFFEGVALSTTAIKAGFKSKKLPLLLACLYALTTPIGISIGVAVSGSFNENSQTSLLVQGIFDAISAGILIYDAMVNLMTTSITHSSEFARLSGLRKCLVFISLWLGAGVMALLGRWA
jgi:zinc transporter 1/2/3